MSYITEFFTETTEYEIAQLNSHEDIRRKRVTLIFGTLNFRSRFKVFFFCRKIFLILQPEFDSELRIFFFVS